MRLVIQRVLEASVTVQGTQVSKIGRGFLVLLGITHEDNNDTLQKYANKLLQLQAWPKIKEQIQTENENNGEEEKVSKEGKKPIPHHDYDFCTNVVDNDYEIIVVSQFTLYGKLKGNKPDFHGSLNQEEAKTLYEDFVTYLKKTYKEDKIQTGKFRNRMAVDIKNDGPVTIVLDSEKDVE